MTRPNSAPRDLHFRLNSPYFGLLSVVARIYAQSLPSLHLPRKFKDSFEGQQGLLFYFSTVCGLSSEDKTLDNLTPLDSVDCGGTGNRNLRGSPEAGAG